MNMLIMQHIEGTERRGEEDDTDTGLTQLNILFLVSPNLQLRVQSILSYRRTTGRNNSLMTLIKAE